MLHGYRLVELLGHGAFSRVYRAEHLVLPRVYAVKILGADAAERPRAVRRFEREAKLLAALSHPNIVGIADFGTTPGGLPFLTMELVAGRTLEQVLEHESDFDFERIVSLTRQIACGLAAAHERGVVHRDLKPANVMVAIEDGVERAKILDFGCALFLDQEMTRLTHAGAIVGTPAWAAPEQLEDSSAVGPAADLFALGEIMLALMSAKTFEALEDLGHALLETDPARRPSAVEVIAHLDQLLAGPAHAPTIALSPAQIAHALPPPPPHARPSDTRPLHATHQLAKPATAEDELPAPPRAQPSLRVIIESRSTPWFLLVAAFAIGLAFALVLVLKRDQSPLPITAPPAEHVAPALTPGVVPRELERDEERAEELEAEAPAEQEPKPERTRARERERERARPAPRDAKSPQKSAQKAALETALRAKGLTSAELADDPHYAKLREAASSDPETNTAALLAYVQRFELDDAILDAKLRRLAAALAELAARLPPEDIAPLERRYLDLRARAGARPDPRERESIARAALQLAAELRASANRGAP